MKYLVVLVLVLGFACGSEAESLTENMPMVAKGLNLFEQFNPEYAKIARSVVSIVEDNEGLEPSMRALQKTLGIKGIGDAIVGPIADIALRLLANAIEIMGLVGLVVLLIFLIDGGDVKSLIGNRRNGRSVGSLYDNAVDLLYRPDVEALSKVALNAIDKHWQ